MRQVTSKTGKGVTLLRWLLISVVLLQISIFSYAYQTYKITFINGTKNSLKIKVHSTTCMYSPINGKYFILNKERLTYTETVQDKNSDWDCCSGKKEVLWHVTNTKGDFVDITFDHWQKPNLKWSDRVTGSNSPKNLRVRSDIEKNEGLNFWVEILPPKDHTTTHSLMS